MFWHGILGINIVTFGSYDMGATPAKRGKYAEMLYDINVVVFWVFL